MSHFTVLVVGSNFEEQLAPFQENNMGDCPRNYLEFHNTEDELIAEFEEDICEVYVNESLRNVEGKNYWRFKWDSYFTQKYPIHGTESPGLFGHGPDIDKERIQADGWELKELSYKELYDTFEEFCTKHHGYNERDLEMGKYGYWENPNAKWDWYQVGGRWAGFFKIKPGSLGIRSDSRDISWIFDNKDPYKGDIRRMDSAKMGDIDWETMHLENREEAEQTWKEWEAYKEDFGNDGTDFETAFKKFKEDKRNASSDINTVEEFKQMRLNSDGHWRFGVRSGETKEAFIARREIPTTFAIIKNGEWYERGEMGWWGVVSDEKPCKDWQETFAELLEDVDSETLLTVVDCHI